ncbi:tetratricopeptide repeat protein [Pelotalea chapellei]|uniref:Tetratricopeptide repeat protein n=1 Tax=Pelotalea chapellei TaxID=44671 RepID=A0ABS5UAQ2_9BACT|nr:tetratricopeptide repeat protein [Pelotalea chapellei]MBT1072730.1 tetratricopeptide repeat protein [Pelotalea chapellei]
MMNSQNLILIEGAATYERILNDIREVEVDEAIRNLKDFLKIYPDFARAHNDLAVLYHRAGDSLKALAHHEKAHKLDPANITYQKNLADFYFVELEWTGDAIHIYLGILKDNPFDIEALNALGYISLQIGRKEQARQYFNRTLQLDSYNQSAQQALQQLLPPGESASAPQPAAPPVQPAQPAPTIQPAQPAPVVPSFQELFKAAQPAPVPAAAPPQQKQQGEPPRSADQLYREALQLANSGKTDEAIQLLEKIVQQSPDHAVGHNDLGVLHQKSGQPEKSRLHHEEAARLQPANKVFQKNLADLLYAEFGEVEEALNIYVRLQAKAPQDIEILKAIASICLSIGKESDARFFLERILTLQPWDREAQEALKELKTAGKDKI